MTTITASALYIANQPIAKGRVALMVCNQLGQPVAFRSGIDIYAPGTPFTGTITNGAIDPGLQVVDLATILPIQGNATLSYSITISDDVTWHNWTLIGVTGITGATWSLDNYEPSTNVVVQAAAFSSGNGPPPSHTGLAPAIYLQLDTGQMWACFAGQWETITSGGGFTGNNDQVVLFVESISQYMGACSLNSGYGVASSSDSTRVVVGLAAYGANANNNSTLRISGTLSNPQWNWMLNQPIFIDTTGKPTQTPPSSGYIQAIGFPLSATEMVVTIREPIYFV